MLVAGSLPSQLVNETGGVAGTETVVDVYHCNAAGAGIEHRQQRGDAAKTCAVADAGRHGNDRLVNEAADDARQRAFHAGNDNKDVGGQQFFVKRKEPVDAGNTNIVIFLHAVAHDFSGDYSFLSDRDIGGAGAENGNYTTAFWLRFKSNGNGARGFMILGFRESAFDGPVSFLAGAGGKEIVVVLENCAGNLDDLGWRFAFAIDDFGEAFAQRPVPVHTREIKVVRVERFELARGGSGFDLAGLHGGQQLDKPGFVHTGTVPEHGERVAEKIDGRRVGLADSNRMTNFNNPFGALTNTGLPAGPATPPKPVKLGRVVLRKEKAHRGGKTVIVVHDFAPQITDAQIEAFAGKLKKACGCGGTVKDRTIEVQGDQPGKIRVLLEAEGFQVAGVK